MAATENILVSPRARDTFEIPKIPIMDYVFKHLRAKMSTLKGKVWLEAVDTGECIKFDEVEDSVKRFASALTKLGFKKGDLLLYCTHNVNQLHLIRFAVWLLGGITKGINAKESKEINFINLKETPPNMILIDEDTRDDIAEAMLALHLSVPILCFGNCSGAISVKSLLNDDGLGIPDKIDIDPVNDIFCYIPTSGSTGPPKTIPHTSYSFISALLSFPDGFHGKKMLCYGAGNSGTASILPSLQTLMGGTTLLRASHFEKNSLINWIAKHKPDSILLYTFLANWFARTIKEMNLDFSFLKQILVGGAPLNIETVKILSNSFPNAKIIQGYGVAEFSTIVNTYLDDGNVPKFHKLNGEEYAACGTLVTYTKLKIVDPTSGKALGANQKGEIYLKSPSSFPGYYDPTTASVNRSCFDSDGWFRTSDIGFYDDEFNLYVVGRWSFLFKFRSKIISPIEIESCLNKHEAVLSCAVTPIPDVDNDNLARAYVTLLPGYKGMVTEKDLIDYAAKNLFFFKQLHGGVKFIDKIPENQHGKIDRVALRKLAQSDK